MKNAIFLYGPPASGKSIVARILAENLKLAFIDLDQEIEKASGKTIPEIFAKEGEAKFREIEKQTLISILGHSDCVVALGGGTLLDPVCLDQVKKAGSILALKATQESLLSRLNSAEASQRPLLANQLEKHLQNLLEKRTLHYNSFSLQLDTDGKSPQKIALEAQVLLGRYTISAKSELNYGIQVTPNGMDFAGDWLQEIVIPPTQVAVLTDDQVGPIYASKIKLALEASGFLPHHIQIPSGEKNKNLRTIEFLWNELIAAHLDRQSLVLALGGGVVSDLAGFSASTYLRGIPWVVIPTSLLAMVDASFGGKTGFDLPQAKNLIGAFHSPLGVLVDPAAMATLPDIEIRNGMAEVVKHGVIEDPTLYEDCVRGIPRDREEWSAVIKKAIAVKVRIVQADPQENGRRAVLNFGHTIGHALEILSNFNLRHGEAVSIGMVLETGIAERMGIARRGLQSDLRKVLEGLGLPVQIPMEIGNQMEQLVEVIQFDKKRMGGTVRFSLPAEIGDVRTGVVVEHLKELL